MTQIKPRVFRTVAELLGGHYHVTISSAGHPAGTFAKLGDIVMDEHDYHHFKAMFRAEHLDRTPKDNFVAKFWDDFGGPRPPDDTWTKEFLSVAEAQKFFNQQIDEAIQSDNGIGYASAELLYGDEVIARYARVK